uniref:Alternative protein TET3 n=1 Tax=Homo sapiens TaxID=9606 RepID=L8EBE0_HUMAN|nr:alternative protein TET3 [Homo sapiens]
MINRHFYHEKKNKAIATKEPNSMTKFEESYYSNGNRWRLSHLPSVPCPRTPSTCSANIWFLFCSVLFSLPVACKGSACKVLCYEIFKIKIASQQVLTK